MIHIVTRRSTDSIFCTSDETVTNALVRLIKYELGYGGHIVSLSPTEIVTRTQIFSMIDITTFSGTPEEMMPLYIFCAYMIIAMKHGGDTITELALKTYFKSNNIVGRALYVISLGVITMGEVTVRSVLHMILEIVPDPRLYYETDLLIALFELHLESGMTGAQLLEALEPRAA